jgi:hypothetical protein
MDPLPEAGTARGVGDRVHAGGTDSVGLLIMPLGDRRVLRMHRVDG